MGKGPLDVRAASDSPPVGEPRRASIRLTCKCEQDCSPGKASLLMFSSFPGKGASQEKNPHFQSSLLIFHGLPTSPPPPSLDSIVIVDDFSPNPRNFIWFTSKLYFIL